MDQCLTRVYFRNLLADEGGFSAPSPETPDVDASQDPCPHPCPPSDNPPAQEQEEQELLEWINMEDFSLSPPKAARRTLCTLLRTRADAHAVGQGRALEGWKEVLNHGHEEMSAMHVDRSEMAQGIGDLL